MLFKLLNVGKHPLNNSSSSPRVFNSNMVGDSVQIR